MNEHFYTSNSPSTAVQIKCPCCDFNALNIPSHTFAALKSLHDDDDAPPNASIASLQRTFEGTSTTLRDLISAHQSILARMEEAQATVDATLHNISLILHPMPFLPDDVLSAIFHWCIPYPHPPAKNNVVDSLCATQPPWLLSYVCSRWRSLALSSPTLWSTLSIPLDYRSHIPYKDGSWRLALYLERSGTTKLDVVLQEHDPYKRHDEFGYDDNQDAGYPQFSEHRKTFLKLLRPTTPRWRRLELDVAETCFQEISDCSFPSLRQLVYQVHGEEVAFPFRRHRDMGGLVELTIRSWCEFDPAWGNVRVVTLCPWMVNQLPKMAHLEVLYIYDLPMISTEYCPVPCALPNLHTIAFLRGSGIYDIDYLLSKLVSPALRTLVLRFHEEYEGGSEDKLECDQLRHLRDLSIEISGEPCSDTILTLFSRTTSVTALSLGPNNATPEVLDALRGDLLPSLTSLRLDFSTLRERPEKVVSMMEARCDGIRMAALEDVTFVRSGGDAWLTAESLSRIASTRWSGLREKIVVRYVDSDLRVL